MTEYPKRIYKSLADWRTAREATIERMLNPFCRFPDEPEYAELIADLVHGKEPPSYVC